MNKFALDQQHLDLMRREGESHYPEECCGFLIGEIRCEDSRLITEVLPIRNQQDVNRARRFLISPEEFRHAEIHARQTGKELLGFYHTHPDHPALPSEFDREHALPFYSYLILSVRDGQAFELRSWRLELDRSRYTEEEVNVSIVTAPGDRPVNTEITK